MAYIGKTPSQATRQRYYFTATGGETSLSGADDNSNTLLFSDGNYVDVILNGVTLVAGTDYNTTTANTIGGLSALTASDVVEIIVYDTFSVFGGDVKGDFTIQNGTLTAGDATFTGTVSGINTDLVNDTTPQLGGNLDTNGNDITFGDNDKAIFGAGSDLQIYHDGSNSIITETGTGDLRLAGANKVELRQSGSSKVFLDCNADGAVQLRYNNGEKLATTSTGIDVTGTVTADGLTVDGAAFVQANLPLVYLKENDTTDLNTLFYHQNGNFSIRTANDANNSVASRIGVDHSTGDISFYEDTGTTPTLFWDASAEALGIGTTSPSASLEVAGTTRISSASAMLQLEETDTTDSNYQVRVINGDLTFQTNNDAFNSASTKMVIDSSGNVGIGTSSPSERLEINSGGGNIGAKFVSTDSLALIAFKDNSTSDVQLLGANGNNLVFYSGAVPTERMRIDASGFLLINRTSGLGTSKLVVEADTTTENPVTISNSRSSSATDYSILFYRNGSIVGSVQTSLTSTTYVTSSDYRLKENVVDMTGAITRVKALAPKRFNFIADADDTTVDGFLAHEAQSVVPEAVTGTHNEVDDDGNAVMQGIDQAKLVPLLTGALQEAIAKIETLETTQADLLARIETLEGN